MKVRTNAGVSDSPLTEWNGRILTITVVTAGAAICAVLWFALTSTGIEASTITPRASYPIGIVDSSQPSGQAPPGVHALAGYTRSYVNDFTGTSLPAGWAVFVGVPGGDPGGQFGAAHVTVGSGLLQLNTWKDPAYHNKWVTGGLSQFGIARTYGAYFARSRLTGPGPNSVELLWPAANVWPPEIDFNENGGSVAETSSTVHFGPRNLIDQRKVNINMTQWHTWGVIWTPASITYTVDGKVWGAITSASEIPHQPMTLDFEQRAMCSLGRECPTAPVSMHVDWVAEYIPG